MQVLGELWPNAVRTVRAPSSRTGDAEGALGWLASVVCAVGLFTLSWEVLGNVSLGPYNVKLPVLLLGLAAVLSIRGWVGRLRVLLRVSTTLRWVFGLGGATVVVIGLRAVTSQPLGPGLAQFAAVVTGAALPALAVLGVVRNRADARWALQWLVGGAVLTSLFGFYQLVAFYTGLPQGVAYTGVGTSGTGGRISALSYEPAYFASFLVLVVGAVIAMARLSDKPVAWRAIVFFSLMLILVNVRALLFILPVAAVLLAFAWRRNRGLLARWIGVGVILLGAVTAVTAGIGAALAEEQQASSPVSTAPGVADESPAHGAERQLPEPSAPQLPTNVLDPSEPSSNGPRIDLYKAVLKVDLAHPIVGVGPGHLRDALAHDGYVAPNQGVNVVANNIWLQAGADGGLVLVILEGGLAASLVVLWWRSRRSTAHPLLSTVLAVLGVGGLLTSYFFDIKLWVMAAIAIMLVAVDGDGDQPTSASA